MIEQRMIRFAMIRGGTSKGVYIMKNDLPADPVLRDKVVLAIFGSPDPRQIDGLGGADPLTSKLAMIGAPTREGCDCDYIFAQVDIFSTKIQWGLICGNLSAGVGPFAIDEGLVKAKDPITTVKINLPTLKPPRTLVAEVPVIGGKAKVDGDYHIDGVPGTGAKIGMDWSDMAGGATGKLLPTGNVRDILDVPGVGKVEASIVVCPNPIAYCRAQDFGIKGTEGPREFDSNEKLIQMLSATMDTAAKLINFHRCGVILVTEPADYVDHTTNRPVRADEADFLSRVFIMGKLHKVHNVGGAANIGVAAKMPGSIVNEVCRKEALNRLELRIGHPAGIMTTEVDIEVRGPGDFHLKRDTIFRTARRIMDGYVYVPKR